MRTNNCKTILKAAVRVLGILPFAAVVALGQQVVNLTAGPAATALPDGSTVPMWGYSCGAAAGSCGNTGTTPPSGTIANSPSGEAGFAFMWHSHNEREITTNNIFPGGMLMMMLVDSREFQIDESN